jgi:hypothetical protein
MIDAADWTVLQGILVAPHAIEWLGQARGPRVHSLYRQSLNLIDRRGDLFSMVLPAVGPGPFALVVQPSQGNRWPASGFAGRLRVDSTVRLKADAIEVGPLEIRLTDLETWQPSPDWDRFGSALTPEHLERLDQLLRHHAPAGSLAPLADRSARALWSESAPREDLGAALLHTIAGLARQLLSGLVRSDRGQIQGAASKLAGLGGGVTPAGDDFMLGAIHALWAAGEMDRVPDLGSAVVEAARSRTNAISLAWLRAAARGEAGNEWHALFEAILAGRPIDEVARVLIRRGHTSGADALAGFVAARRALVASEEARRPIAWPS